MAYVIRITTENQGYFLGLPGVCECDSCIYFCQTPVLLFPNSSLPYCLSGVLPHSSTTTQHSIFSHGLHISTHLKPVLSLPCFVGQSIRKYYLLVWSGGWVGSHTTGPFSNLLLSSHLSNSWLCTWTRIGLNLHLMVAKF